MRILLIVLALMLVGCDTPSRSQLLYHEVTSCQLTGYTKAIVDLEQPSTHKPMYVYVVTCENKEED